MTYIYIYIFSKALTSLYLLNEGNCEGIHLKSKFDQNCSLNHRTVYIQTFTKSEAGHQALQQGITGVPSQGGGVTVDI